MNMMRPKNVACSKALQSRSALVYKPCLLRARFAAAFARQSRRAIAVQAQQQAAEPRAGLQAQEVLVLPTIFANAPKGSDSTLWKANVVLPPSASSSNDVPTAGDKVSVKRARGVVLFMHGFAQGPTAYARMLNQLAAETNALVVAPCPPFASTPEAQQKAMVDHALFWRDLIATNNLPGITMDKDTYANVGLLGHSVGGGLAAYVTDAAARSKQPFTAAHVMAPQVNQVVDDFRYNSPANKDKLLAGSDTVWGLQYGLLDLLSLAPTVLAFRGWLAAKDEKELVATTRYNLGSHVGFEDQLVVGRESFTTDFLPWVLAVLWGALALWLPAAGLTTLSSLSDDGNVRAAQPDYKSKGKEGSTPSAPGFGPPDDVELPDERVMLLGYTLLAATVTAIESIIPGFDWSSWSSGALSVLKAVFLILAVGSWPAIALYPYQATKQRPESRRQVVSYFTNVLVPQRVAQSARK